MIINSESFSVSILSALHSKKSSNQGHFCFFFGEVIVGKFIESVYLDTLLINIIIFSNKYLDGVHSKFSHLSDEVIFNSFSSYDVLSKNGMEEGLLFLNWTEAFDGYTGFLVTSNQSDIFFIKLPDGTFEKILIPLGEFFSLCVDFLNWYVSEQKEVGAVLAEKISQLTARLGEGCKLIN